jgi:DNA-binding transcriptional LysR family regulator
MRLSDRIGKRIKLQDIHVLMAVVQAGSMRKAARDLNSSQPNISKSIADLEHTLGVQLLDRHHQGIAPTQYGRALFDGGTAVFDELRQTIRSIEFLSDPTAGEVRIGCNPFLAASLVSTVVDQLSRRHPRMTFRLVTGYVETLHGELLERNVDLLITRKSGPMIDDRLNYERLFDESYSFAVGAQNPLARRRALTYVNWRTSRGCCRRRKVSSVQSRRGHSAPVGSTIRARPSSRNQPRYE